MSDLLLGEVAYDPKVVTIWDGFRRWLRARGFGLDHVLYAHYERLVEDLVAGHLDVAWCSPLAWVRPRRLAAARGVEVSAAAMRDTDRDLTSVVVVPAESPVGTIADLAGGVVATGAVDSPQATLLPLSLLRSHGLEPGRDVEVRRFDVGVGLHGDHVGGERDAAAALAAGKVDAAGPTPTTRPAPCSTWRASRPGAPAAPPVSPCWSGPSTTRPSTTPPVSNPHPRDMSLDGNLSAALDHHRAAVRLARSMPSPPLLVVCLQHLAKGHDARTADRSRRPRVPGTWPGARGQQA